MSAGNTLHSLLHTRFQEVFGPPHHDLLETEQWSLEPSDGKGSINVLLNGTPAGPLVWVFNPQDPQNAAMHLAVTHADQIDDLIARLKRDIAGTSQPLKPAPGPVAFLDDVLTTRQLEARPSRSPDYAAENQALLALAQGMARDPQTILQLTVDTAMHLCRGHSAGVSILEKQENTEVFRWRATAGAFASLVGRTMPMQSPCGTVIDRNALLMFGRPELHYNFPGIVDLPIEEVIMAPFHVGGKPLGTVWVVAHTEDRKFDREDVRRLASVAHFAGAAYQVIAAMNVATQSRTQMSSALDAAGIHSDELEAIVAQRTQELLETHQRLRLAERMATMGTLSAGLGHDMGNMVLAMRTRLELLEQGADSAKEHVQVLGDCVAYLQSLAGGLRLMAIDPTDKKLGPEKISLAAWWTAAHRVLASGITMGIVVESRVPEDLPEVFVNRAGLTQAVYNVVQNAADAIQSNAAGDGEGRITIAADVDATRSKVVLRISDDGPGMTEDVRLHCLDPFFSAKSDSTATGLGLALVHSVMKAAGGDIRIETELGRGSTVILALPIAR